MTEHHFQTRTFTNSNSIHNSGVAKNFHFNNSQHQQNYDDRNRMTYVTEDWDREVEEDKTIQTNQWIPKFNQQPTNIQCSFQNLPQTLDKPNSYRSHATSYRFSHSYLINSNVVSRLIGKGGETIKHIQLEYNVQIKVANDRQNQWIDITISGSSEQVIENAFNHIRDFIGDIRERNELPQSYSLKQTRLDQPNTFTYSKVNDSTTNFEHLSNNNRNENSFASWSHSKSRQSANRHRFVPAGNEEDDDETFLASNDDSTDSYKLQPDKTKLTSIFSSAFSRTTNNTDTTKRVDWAKMRLTDTANDMTKWKDFPPVVKEFYDELPDIASMSNEEVQALRAEKNNIIVSWFDLTMKDDYEKKHNHKLTIPNPIYEFAHAFHNYPDIMKEIIKQGFVEPSPIQCQAWPIALRGYDFIGIAQTGTGKTLAFLLPALIHIDSQPKSNISIQGPKALILSPTRELAIQIHQEVQKYNYRGIRSAVIYGGSSRKNQIYQCEAGVEIIIATPGRLNDLVMNNIIDLRSVTFLVLDEADRMLDMGFEPQIVKILLDIRPDRQTIMTSATWPEDVRRIAARYMRNPIQIYVGTIDLATVHSVRQDIEIVKEEEKFELLLDFIGRLSADDKMIVFVDRKSSADAIASELIRKRISCQSIHGDREQSDREQALEDLKQGAVNILVATDVASRGLDIQDITVIFNYDLPKSMEDYVHRVGRTGRAGKTGYAISLVTRENWGSAGRLIKILEEAEQNIPGELREMAERFQTMQERKRELGGGRNRYGNRDRNSENRFFGFDSVYPRTDRNGRNHERPPTMNSGWSFSS